MRKGWSEFAKKFLIAAVVALAPCSVAWADDPILIGVQVPQTGSSAVRGFSMANAAAVAAQEINAKGGVLGRKVKMMIADAACDPQAAVNAASKLAARHDVVGVIGGYCSGATLPTLKVYGRADIPFIITASNSTKLIPANPGNAVMINSTGDAHAAKVVKFLKKKRAHTLAIVNEGDAFSQDLGDLTAKNWKQEGNDVVAFETVNKGEQDYSAIVTMIKSAKPDAVWWTAYYADGALLIRQLRQAGYRGIIVVCDGSISDKLFDIAGRAAEGVFGISAPIAELLPKAARFVKTYKAKYKSAPGPFAALTYDGMQLMAWAISSAGSTDPDAIIKALASVNGQEWLTGPIVFTKDKTLARSNFIVVEGKGGHWVSVGE